MHLYIVYIIDYMPNLNNYTKKYHTKQNQSLQQTQTSS